ncbi:hypothetical protein PR202_gb02892 [Eleusine coracana subsp. coracana]|uniref:PWWP domain-containing protein n=1 Tax=Eleusine coracana subsp. coracana TaxID=191504 RepID=A0AAV5DXZ9_ELECO|nr:hypothetical protein PR202_gb02892 [Eleusine coracana subsp. coracana]
MVVGSSDKGYEHPSTSELPENKLRHNFRLGDMIWVKHSGSSWWPAQCPSFHRNITTLNVSEFKVVDEACVSSKPKKKAKNDCLVRLYGTCQYLYVDPWKSNTDFKMVCARPFLITMLKQESKSATEVFREVLEKELSRVNSSNDYDEESDNSEGTQTKVATKKTSSRKVRKQEGLKQCSYKYKGAATTEDLEDESEDQDQEFGNPATTGVSVQKGKRRRGRKNEFHVLDKGGKIGASVVRREGLRRSSRASAKEDLDEAADGTVSLTDTGPCEETSGSHTEIKAMVRDILFKEIIDREHDAEMAFVDEVINGICNSTMDSMTSGATASTKCEQGINNGTGVEGESSNVTQRERKGKSDEATEGTMQVTRANPLKEVMDTTPVSQLTCPHSILLNSSFVSE